MPAGALPPLLIDPIAAFADNYFWLLARGAQAVVVDPGEAAPVVRALGARSLRLAAILVTHHHADHVGGVAALAARYGAPVYGPAFEAIPGRTAALADGDRVELLGLTLQVLEVPGHTAGHIAYYSDSVTPPLLLAGDTLFGGGCGRVFEGTPAQMAASLARLAALPPATRLYCAHEYTLANLAFAQQVEPDNPALLIRLQRDRARRARQEATLPSTIGDERATNPFLRCDVPAVRAAAERRAAGAGADPVATFTAIRQWKNSV